MSSGVELIYEKVPIGANLFKNAENNDLVMSKHISENDDLVMSKYVKSHFKQLL